MQLSGNLYTTISNLKKFGEDFLLDFDENDSNEFIIIKYMNNAYQLENKNGKRVIIDTKKWNELKHTYKADPAPVDVVTSFIESVKTTAIPVINTTVDIDPVNPLPPTTSTTDVNLNDEDDISAEDLKKIQEEMAGKSDPERKVGRKPGSTKK